MIRKISYSVFSILILAAATFAVAPMAFCQMKAPERSCCPKPKANHCNPTNDERCPICSHDLCKLDPTPVAKNTETPRYRIEQFAPVAFDFSPASMILAPGDFYVSYRPIDSSPPLYLQHSVLRL